jgi:hypothetical protein
MNRTPRRLWGLVAAGAATAVGITTRDAGFVVITFIGSLALPRILGLRGPGAWRGGACAGRHSGRAHLEERMAEWHRQAHARTATSPGDAAPVA